MSLVHGSKHPLDSRQLRAFATLARTGSFTRAGKELFISQSGVSHSMKALESDIGCRLFDRLGKKVHLTPAGEHFLHHAERILEEMTAARSALEHLGEWGKGRLRVGAGPTTCQYILPGVFREFKRSFPQTSIAIQPCDAGQAHQLLHDKRIDLAITLRPDTLGSCEFEPVFTDELVFLVAPEHPWAAARQVVREDLVNQSFVLYSKTSHTFRLIDAYFHHEKISLNTVAELGSMEAIKEFVKLGLGITVLAPWVAKRELAEGTLVALPVGKRRLKRTWGLVHLHQKRRNLAEETFIRLFRTACENLTVSVRPQTTAAPVYEGS